MDIEQDGLLVKVTERWAEMINNDIKNLIHDMYDALQDFCECQVPDTECPMWKEEFRRCGKQCRFRDIEDKMRKLGLDDMVVE